MCAPLPQVGSGEPVADLMAVLGKADAAIVLVEGKPTGVVSRQDLLAFLARTAQSLPRGWRRVGEVVELVRARHVHAAPA